MSTTPFEAIPMSSPDLTEAERQVAVTDVIRILVNGAADSVRVRVLAVPTALE